MKRDTDYMRDLLLEIEVTESDIALFPRHKQSDQKQIHHVDLLCDAGFLLRISDSGYRLTNSGHDYLDAIRDSGIWNRTKEAVAESGGNATLEILKSLAVGFLKKKIAQHTDIEI